MNLAEFIEIDGQWRSVRDSIGDDSVMPGKWYASYNDAPSTPAEITLCQKHAAEGNERAQRYIAKFMELRLLGG